MNLLLDVLPQHITIEDVEYAIHANFRNILLIEQLMADEEIPDSEKPNAILELFYKEMPKDPVAALHAFLQFYRHDSAETCSGVSAEQSVSAPLISTEHDAPYIYTAFLRTYGINLNTIAFLHWYEYCAMLRDLSEECMLCKIIGYRSTEPSSMKDAKQRQFYAQQKKRYALPPSKVEREQRSKIETALIKGESITGLLG